MIPSYASDFVCLNADQFANFGLEINHDAENEVTYDDIAKVNSFKIMVESSNV
ncbi:hypothetical protein KKH82_00010 [Patescibacteria group bacterium]|nr:hypothetical protein [Patescibacteria group bacterium]